MPILYAVRGRALPARRRADCPVLDHCEVPEEGMARKQQKAGVGGWSPALGSYPMRVACTFCVLAGAPVLEGAPVGLGAGVHGPAEVLPEVGCRGEAAFLRD